MASPPQVESRLGDTLTLPTCTHRRLSTTLRTMSQAPSPRRAAKATAPKQRTREMSRDVELEWEALRLKYQVEDEAG